MSHFTTIKTLIKDIAALKAACAELGLEVIDHAEEVTDSKTGRTRRAIRKLKKPYEDLLLNRDQWPVLTDR